MIDIKWADAKAMIDAGLKFKAVVDTVGRYNIIMQDYSTVYRCIINIDSPASADQADYEANYASLSQTVLSSITSTGRQTLATTKPDGVSKTYISHNLATDGSTWQFDHLGVLTKVYKAEVQFTLDVMEPFNTDANKIMNLDIMAGGAPVLSEQKVFNNIYDVFDLGNKHYYTPDGGSASMGGGVTTIVFDYTDAITLDPALAMAMRFSLNNDTALGGTHCSVSLVAGPA